MHPDDQDKQLRSLAARFLSDGVIEDSEILELYGWLTGIEQRTKVSENLLFLIRRICADSLVTSTERLQLLKALKSVCNQASKKEKGNAFEEYVITRFDNREYELIEWRSDKEIQGWGFPLSIQWPDIVMRKKSSNKLFAIECKYKSFFCSTTKWAEEYQIHNYQRFQSDHNMLVFVALGVGGCASLPDKFYVARLNQMETPILPCKYLERFLIKDTVLQLSLE